MTANRWKEKGSRALIGALVMMLALTFNVAVGQDNTDDADRADFSRMVPEVAQRGITRRQELVAKADEAALRGQRLMADRDYAGAVDEFKRSLDLLPDAPVVADRKNEYTKLFADSSVLLARQRAEEGRYSEAIDLVQAVLSPEIDPENDAAKRLVEDLNDPDIYTPALTPEHIARVKRVETALKVAASFVRLGDYDSAERSYHEVLGDDPYNSSARRGMEALSEEKRNYYDTAYDHMRAHALTEVSKLWELQAPRYVLGSEYTNPPDIEDPEQTGIEYINEKLTRINIPEIEFDDTPLSQAIEFLRTKSVELDELEPDPAKKGINIIIRTSGGGGGGGAAPAPDMGDGGLGFDTGGGGGGGGFGGGGGGDDPSISLRLTNVPLVEALRYTTDLARLQYKVEPHAVVIVPLGEVSTDLYTKTFSVPPGFLSQGGGDGGGGGGGPVDPFAALDSGGGGGTNLRARQTALELLETQGITFPPGASAIYTPGTSQLVVRNTQANLDLVEAYIDSIREKIPKQIYITTKFVEIRQDDHDEFGFDWLLGASNLPGSDKVFTSGGTNGTTRTQVNPIDFPFIPPGGGTPLGTFPLTSANRFGSNAVSGNSIDNLLSTTTAGASTLSPGIFSIGGVFTDPQFQAVLRAISQHKGSDLLSAPSIMAKSGQRAKIEVIREFIYPSEYDPPEIPDQFGAIGNAGGGGGAPGNQGSVQSFPVVPANPAAFETRNVGVTLEVDPVIGADGFTIDLNLNPEVVEFEGFINYGSPIFTSGTDAAGNPVQVQLTENRIEMPVFATRRVTTSVTIWDGQTVAVGGLIREDIQHVQDKVPLLGDIPGAGFFFRSEAEVHSKRNLTVFVTANLVDPAGMRINDPARDANMANTP
ncbi:MAG: general secretion pathway protein D [Verrucomicrobiales bacterium]|jgi:general secretion pathway protein D